MFEDEDDSAQGQGTLSPLQGGGKNPTALSSPDQKWKWSPSEQGLGNGVPVAGPNREAPKNPPPKSSPPSSAGGASSAGSATLEKRRRIPGPAGMDRRAGGGKRRRGIHLEGASGKSPSESSPRGASGDGNGGASSYLSSPAWRQMLSDHGQDERDPDAVINRFNIKWIKSSSSSNGGGGFLKHSPALFCVIRSLDLSSLDPKCELEDRSGVVAGMIHRDVVENHGACIAPGTVLVIKDLQVRKGLRCEKRATFRERGFLPSQVIMSLRSQHVIVTMSNLATMYRSNAGSGGPGPGLYTENVHRLTKEDLESIARATDKYEREKLGPMHQEGLRKSFQASSASSLQSSAAPGPPPVIRR